MTAPIDRPTLVPPTPVGPSRWFLAPRNLVVVAVVGVAAYLLGQFGRGGPPLPPTAALGANPTTAGTGGQPPPPSSSPNSVESRKRADDQAAADTARKDMLARARLAQQQTVAAADEAARAADEGLAELDRWEAEITPLLTGDAGRAVAAKPELVRAFRAVYGTERPSRDEFLRIKAQTEAVTAPVRQALISPDNPFQQTGDTEKQLTKLIAAAQVSRDALRGTRAKVASVAALAKTSVVPADTPTLAAAMQAIDFREALEAASVIEAARDAARKEATALMAETKGESVRLAGQADARREAAKAEVERTRVDLETRALTSKAEKDKLRAKALTPEVRQDLAVFLAKGYTQPSPGVGGYERFPGVLQPVSYSRLVTMGCLEQTPQGLTKLLRVGAEPRRGNDRPQWKFYAFELRPEAEPFLKRVQALLTELGPVLVEDGLLAP